MSGAHEPLDFPGRSADRAAAVSSSLLVPAYVETVDLNGFRHFTRPEAILSMREVVKYGTGEMAIMILLDNRETFRVKGDIDQLAKQVFG